MAGTTDRVADDHEPSIGLQPTLAEQLAGLRVRAVETGYPAKAHIDGTTLKVFPEDVRTLVALDAAAARLRTKPERVTSPW